MRSVRGLLTGLTEQVLQILPAYIVRKLCCCVNTGISPGRNRTGEETNVRDIDLAATTTLHAGAGAAVSGASTVWAWGAGKSAAGGRRESGFGFAVLADIDQAAHQVLVR